MYIIDFSFSGYFQLSTLTLTFPHLFLFLKQFSSSDKITLFCLKRDIPFNLRKNIHGAAKRTLLHTHYLHNTLDSLR